MDRFSQLPDFIVHHILYFFKTLHSSPAELVRMSVLSKTWFHLTASFPILYFYISDFTSRESFFKYVEYTTSRFCHQNVTAHKLKLVATLRDPAELDIVNRCVELVLEKGVRDLVIDLSDFTISLYVPKYRLPNTLLSVSVLKYLTIRGCELPSSLMPDAVKFKSLIRLQLKNVHIDDEMIKNLTVSCPLLVVVVINSCYGFKSFCVSGHQNLQTVMIAYNTRVERIDIEAPNLSCLFIADYEPSAAPRMNLASCKKLKTVVYNGNPLPNSNGFTDFLSNFPFIENFFLATTYKCKNLRLSSLSLRTLMLHSSCNFEELEFSTPNLVSYSYPCDHDDVLSMVINKCWPPSRDLNRLKACFLCYPVGYIDTLLFQKLRHFLDKKTGFKILNLYIRAMYSQKFTELEKLKAIELSPYELEHVELQLESHEESLAHIAFVDAILWCCRPRSLTLRSSFPLTDFEEQSDVVMFTYEKLLQQEDQGHTNIQIVSPSYSFLMALSGEGKAISFIKEEVSEKKQDDGTVKGVLARRYSDALDLGNRLARTRV